MVAPQLQGGDLQRHGTGAHREFQCPACVHFSGIGRTCLGGLLVSPCGILVAEGLCISHCLCEMQESNAILFSINLWDITPMPFKGVVASVATPQHVGFSGLCH